jgi:PAS domain S-box-containing protein
MRRGILMVLCLVLGWLGTAEAAEAGKRVLLVHSDGSVAAKSQAVAFETELTKRMGSEKVYVDEVYLDHARYPETDMESALVEYLEKRVAKWQPDLVVPLVSPACVFVAQHRERLFPSTPILYAGMDKRRLPSDALEKNAAFVGNSLDVPGFAEDILQVAPDTTNIVCVIGASPVEQYWTAVFQSEFARFTNRVSFTWLNDLPFDQMLERVKRLPPRSFVFVILLLRDAAGVAHDSENVLRQICEAANAPVNSIFENQLGLGIVGGRLYSSQAEGVEAARIAFRILRGEPASSFPPVIMGPVGPEYDWRELQRWHINEEHLPRGSIVRFRQPSMWERYKWRIIGVGAVVLAQAGIIFILLANRIKRRRAECSLQQSEERYRAVVQSQTDLICRFLPDSTLTFANDEYCRFFGRSRDELIGRLFLDLIPPQHRDYARAKLEALTREPYRTETEHEVIAADGSVRWQEWFNIAVRDERGCVIEFQGVGHDITERKRVELALRESEERFRMVADAAPVMIWLVDTDKRCTFVNKGWLEFTGRTMEQELGDGWAEGIHPDDYATCLRTYEEAFEAQREFTMEYRIRTRSGDFAWVLDTGTPRFVADGTFAGYVGAATDISALKQAQERWRSVVEGAPNAMLVVSTDGIITLVNARTEEVFGYTRAELIGNPVEMLLSETLRAQPPDHRRRDAVNSTVRTTGSVRELLGRRKDGRQVPLEIGLNSIRTPDGQFLLASIIDTTERRAAEAMLREGEKRMTMVANAAYLGMWVWDAPEKHLWTSAKWKEIHGYAPDEDIRFDALIERVHPEDRDAVGRAVTEACNDRSAFHILHRLLLPDGTVRWISKSGWVEQMANDGPLRLMGISIDVTERKEVEEAAREVSGRLITAQEDERRRIARDLHDDLNQRLAMLSVETDLLGRMDNDPLAQAIVTNIASRVRDISSEVHKLSYQLHPAKLDQLGLVAAARSFCHELSKQFGVPVEFVHEDIPRDLNNTAALCLYRIVQEALQNVAKHSGATSARVELRRREGRITLAVSDNGRGFDMATMGHQAGLGLVGMRERVRLMHGQIAFRSAPKQGTRIEVTVPLILSEIAAT